MAEEEIAQFCECWSFGCTLSVEMTLDEAHRAREGVIIVDGCLRGAEPGEKLLGEGRGYKIYEDSLLAEETNA